MQDELRCISGFIRTLDDVRLLIPITQAYIKNRPYQIACEACRKHEMRACTLKPTFKHPAEPSVTLHC